MKKLIVLMAIAALAMVVTNAQAWTITTNVGSGADAELRESSPNGNRGDSIELASRVDYDEDTEGNPIGYFRNSVSYMKFDISSLAGTGYESEAITVRTTYLNTNLFASRFQDTGGGANTGMEYFVLDPTLAGADWDEMTITPNNAPGYICDNPDDGTKDWAKTKGTRMGLFGSPTAGLTYLNDALFEDAKLIPSVGRYGVGESLELVCAPGSALHDAITSALATDHKTVTVIYGVIHDYTTTNVNWEGFNYTMNSKEQDPLKGDSASPWGGLSKNSPTWGDIFAPALTTDPYPIPEPATMALLGLGGLLLSRKRK